MGFCFFAQGGLQQRPRAGRFPRRLVWNLPPWALPGLFKPGAHEHCLVADYITALSVQDQKEHIVHVYQMDHWHISS